MLNTLTPCEQPKQMGLNGKMKFTFENKQITFSNFENCEIKLNKCSIGRAFWHSTHCCMIDHIPEKKF